MLAAFLESEVINKLAQKRTLRLFPLHPAVTLKIRTILTHKSR
jgi:hypothetical protein